MWREADGEISLESEKKYTKDEKTRISNPQIIPNCFPTGGRILRMRKEEMTKKM